MLLRDRGATSAVDFALVFPLLVILMFATIVLGQAIYSVASVQWAVEHSVRQLMISNLVTDAELEQAVRQRLAGLTDLDVTISYSQDDSEFIPLARVTAEVSYPILVPFIPAFTITYSMETNVPRPFSSAESGAVLEQ